MLLVIRNIAEAQGDVENLVKWTGLSPDKLTYLLSPAPQLELSNVLSILFDLKESPLFE